MTCGNKEHNQSKDIIHPCGICKHWNIDVVFGNPISEPCITCKKGDCQFEESCCK